MYYNDLFTNNALPDWFLRIIESYKLEIYVAPCYQSLKLISAENLISTAFQLDKLKYLDSPSRSGKNLIWKISTLKYAFDDPNYSLYIVIACRITKLQLGALRCHKSNDVIHIYSLASMRGVLLALRIPGIIGTKIGSLLITSLTLLLQENQLPTTIILDSAPNAEGFYLNIGMKKISHQRFQSNTTPFPNESFYEDILKKLNAKDDDKTKFCSALTIQRWWRNHRVTKICQSIVTLLNLIELELTKPNLVYKVELEEFSNYLKSNQTIKKLNNPAACDYIYNTFVTNDHRHNPLINFVVKETLGIVL
jgi:hypothetical protein